MDFKTFVDFLITTILAPSLSLILSAAVVFFLWNIFGVMRKSDQPEELAKMKNRALWGAIAIAVMVSMWGLVNFFTSTFQLDNSASQINLQRFNNSGQDYFPSSSYGATTDSRSGSQACAARGQGSYMDRSGNIVCTGSPL